MKKRKGQRRKRSRKMPNVSAKKRMKIDAVKKLKLRLVESKKRQRQELRVKKQRVNKKTPSSRKESKNA